MKNMKRLMGLFLAMMMLATLFSAMSVSAAGEHKLTISHYNQNDVFSNACVIFTKEYMGDKTLGDVTAEYKAEMGDEIEKVDSDWNSLHTDHKFKSYYALTCAWNEEMAYYEVVATAPTGGAASELSCPENGFIIAAHRDDDIDGDHNYPSTEFGVMNLGKRGGAGMVTSTKWNGFINKPVYLYNVDLSKTEKGAGIETSGTFDSKMSPAGIALQLTERYENFSSKSYVMVGGEDPDATVEPYEPANVTVSFKKIESLQDKMDSLDELDYTTDSWNDLKAAFALHTIGDPAMKNADVTAWAEEINTAFDNLIPFEEAAGGDDVIGGNDTGNDTVVGDRDDKGDAGIPVYVWIILGVLVLGGAAFLALALTKKKTPAEAPVEEAAEAPAEETASEKDGEQE